MQPIVAAVAKSLENLGFEVHVGKYVLTIDGNDFHFYGAEKRPQKVRLLYKRYTVDDILGMSMAILQSLAHRRELKDQYNRAAGVRQQVKLLNDVAPPEVRVTERNGGFAVIVEHFDPAVIRDLVLKCSAVVTLPFELDDQESRLVASDYCEEKGYQAWAEKLRS